MSSTLCSKNANSAARDSSNDRFRLIAWFIKVGLIIIFCEAIIMAGMHLLDVSSEWGIIIDPVLLAVLSTICLWWFRDETADTFLYVATRDSSHLCRRPVILFIKVGLVIIFSEAVIMSALHLLAVNSKIGIILDPPLLAVLGTVCMYWFIVSPMNRILEIKDNEESNLELFRGLIDNSNDAVFIADPGTAKLLDINYRACTTLGYSRTDLLKMTVPDIEESISDESSWSEFAGKVRNNGFTFLTGRHKRKDGTTFPVEVNINLVNWGGRDYMIAIARNAAERENIQAQLKDSEAKFRKLAECAKDAIVTMGPKGEISFWNPAAEKIFGYSYDEAIGKELHELLVPERFRGAFRKGFSGFQKTGKGNAVGKTLKLAALRKDGSEFSMEVSISPVRLEGIWHAVGIIRDTSKTMEIANDFTVVSCASK